MRWGSSVIASARAASSQLRAPAGPLVNTTQWAASSDATSIPAVKPDVPEPMTLLTVTPASSRRRTPLSNPCDRNFASETPTLVTPAAAQNSMSRSRPQAYVLMALTEMRGCTWVTLSSGSMDELLGTLVGRWYVTIFGLAFLWCAVRQLGWRRTALYSAIAVGLGALAENGSVHLGFPYTRYTFNPGLRGDELFIGDVPLMVPLSYTFMAYFAFATGRLLASGPWATRALRPWHEWLLAWVLAVWALWIVDPMSRLGDRFYLGRVFRYEGPGFWFGLPLGSQIGFAATSAILLGVLFWMTRAEPNVAVAGLRRHPHLTALITYNAQVLHMAIVAWVIGADALGGAAVLIWVPAVALTAVYWSVLSNLVRRASLGGTSIATRSPEGSDGLAVSRR